MIKLDVDELENMSERHPADGNRSFHLVHILSNIYKNQLSHLNMKALTVLC